MSNIQQAQNDYTEAQQTLLDAIAKLTKSRIQQVKFDETILCKVVKVYKDDKTKFLVEHEAVKFNAYLDDDLMINEGSQVYVLVPLSDYSKRKVITGVYKADEVQAVAYDAAYSHLVNYYDTMLWDAADPLEVTETTEPDSQSKNLSVYVPQGAYGPYDYIAIEFGIDALLDENVREYALHIYDNLTTPEVNIVFTTNDMLGNPYTTIPQFKQRLVYPMPKAIKYENYMSLTAELQVVGGYAKIPTCKIIFGYNSARSEFKTSGLTIAKLGDGKLEYTDTTTTSLPLIMAYYDSIDKIIYNKWRPYSKNDATIYWARFNDQIGSEYSEVFGVGWEELSQGAANTDINYTASFFPNVAQPYEQIKAIIQFYSEDVNGNQIPQEKIESNIIKYDLVDSTEESAGSINRELKLSLGENDDGKYMAYNNSGVLTDRATYSVTAEFYDKEIKWYDGKETTIIWKIPRNGTLLTFGTLDELQDYRDDDATKKTESKWEAYKADNDSFYGIKATFTLSDNKNAADELKPAEGEIYNKFNYQFVKTGYNPAAKNQIICEVHKNNKIYTNTINLDVMQTNIGGTGYTLRIIPSDYNYPYMTKCNLKADGAIEAPVKLKLKAELYNPTGTKVTINKKNLSWSWFQRNEPWPNKYEISISGGEVVSTRTQVGGSEGGKSYTFIGTVDDETQRQYPNVNGKGGAYYYFSTEIPDSNWEYGDDTKPGGTLPTEVDEVEIYRSSTMSDPYAIVQVTYKNLSLSENGTNRNVNLVAYYPIASMDDEESKWYIQGPVAVTYNSQGVEPQYEKNAPYALSGWDGEQTLTWGIQANGNSYKDFGEIDYNAPSLSTVTADMEEQDKSKKAGTYLMPTPNFHEKTSNGSKLKTSIVAYYRHTGGTRFVCTYPLLITQNAYTANEFVNWYVDQGNEIKPILMAGTLSTKNQFTGVFFGDFKS